MSKNKFEVGDRVLFVYPKENYGKYEDCITDLGLVPFFEEIDGDELEIREIIPMIIYYKKKDTYANGYRYRVNDFNGFNGRRYAKDLVYDEHWFTHVKPDISNVEEVDFFA